MVFKSLVNPGLMILQQYLCEGDAEDGVREFFAVVDGLLGEHFGEVLLHEGVEVSIALPRFEVLPLEECERYDYFK